MGLRTKEERNAADRDHYDPDCAYRSCERVNDCLAHRRILVTHARGSVTNINMASCGQCAYRYILQTRHTLSESSGVGGAGVSCNMGQFFTQSLK